MVHDEQAWKTLQGEVTEYTQLHTYVVSSRMAGLCYMLNIVLQRWFPWLNYDVLRCDATKLKVLDEKDCATDAYAQNLTRCYGEALGGPLSTQALEAGVQEFAPRTSDADRLHGENLRRAMARIASMAQTGAEMCAEYVGRQISTAECQKPLRDVEHEFTKKRNATRRSEKTAARKAERKRLKELALGRPLLKRTGGAGL